MVRQNQLSARSFDDYDNNPKRAGSRRAGPLYSA